MTNEVSPYDGPSSNDILAFTKCIWEDSELHNSFRNVPVDGVLPDMLADKIDAKIANLLGKRNNPADALNLQLAEGVITRLIAGVFKSIEDPLVTAFIDQRKQRKHNDPGGSYDRPSIKQVHDYAKAIRAYEKLWSLFVRIKDVDLPEDEDMYEIKMFRLRYQRRFSLANLSSGVLEVGIFPLRLIAAGKLPDNLDGESFFQAIEKAKTLHLI